MILSKSNIKSLNLDLMIDEYIQQKKLSELLIIVPTNRKIRYLKRELISLSPGQSATGLNLYTIGTFTTKLFESNNFGAANVLSDASAAVLLNKSFKETELKYFSNYKGEIPRGTLDRIKNVISEYKRNGISPEDLISESENLTGSEKLKALDIAGIYKNYLHNCYLLKAFEIGDIYSELNKLSDENFNGHFNVVFNDVKRIIINGFDEFTLPEIEIINKTSKINGIELFVVFDYYRFNPSLFAHLDSCYNKFIERGFNEVVDTSLVYFNDYRKKIRERLFLLNKNEPPINSQIKISQIIASTPDEEITLIAKEIKRLIIEDKVQPDSICVSFNLISDHSVIIRDVFDEYGIPFNLTDRFSLSESQPIVALINLLEVLQNNFYYKNIFRALTGRWIKIDGVDLSNLLRVSSNLKIVSGYKNWIDAIDNALEEAQPHNIDEDNRFLPVELYQKAKEDIEKIKEHLAPFSDRISIKEFYENLRNMVFKLELPQKIINDYPFYIEKNTKALTVFLDTIEKIFDLLSKENGKEKKYSLDYFLTQIKTALQFTRYNIKERHRQGVLVTSVNEIRGLSFDYVFIGGLTDGEFPTRYQPEIFFSGSYRKDDYKHTLEERYHFYQTLCSAEKKVYLSFSQRDEKKDFTASSFIKDINRIFITEKLISKDYTTLIQSKAELLKIFPENKSEYFDNELVRFGVETHKINSDLIIDNLRQKNPFADSPYTGNIFNDISDKAKEKLRIHKEKQYSASQLEEYAKCPFQYFLKRVLQIETVEEPKEELEAFELGSIVHSILHQFYVTINEKNISLFNCDEQTFSLAEDIIFDIAENKIEKLKLFFNLIFMERERILGIEGNKKNSILYRFLEEERKNEEGFIPEFFEVEFGKFNNTSEVYNEVKVKDVLVRGKIDRIDIDMKNNLYKIIDYKLGGKSPSKDDIRNGISLQLPLYVYASKKIIEAELNKTFRPAKAIIYSLKLKRKEFGEILIHISEDKKPDETELIKSYEKMIEICNEVIPVYVNNISSGKFNLSMLKDRDEKVCGYCDFKSICRIQEIK